MKPLGERQGSVEKKSPLLLNDDALSPNDEALLDFFNPEHLKELRPLLNYLSHTHRAGIEHHLPRRDVMPLQFAKSALQLAQKAATSQKRLHLTSVRHEDALPRSILLKGENLSVAELQAALRNPSPQTQKHATIHVLLRPHPRSELLYVCR